MGTTNILLKSGHEISIDNLQKVIQHESGFTAEKTFTSENISEFQIFSGNYSFIGDTVVSINGNEISYVSFDI